ncbi:Hsp33 family molecular chaperone HslO [Entomomonas asaccharolytica]|uniref:33 kDa chaperonin n=1 Tax=Entomomonas asaccharolytica TaxID=2785331 RepID=A0A974RVW7_9GAMM|nr:Hsp33 family molecular chaperone HslO [Entomomonas asaccharolytica]QQP84573.1 Hsp33 family molecular chaperone HslO [Entomomonas asaccharolytica]
MKQDITQRFLFENLDVRGEIVSLEHSYHEVLTRHQYPAPVAKLLGELLAASALLCGTLKFDGTLVLQARSEGPLPLLMVECNSNREIRGIARYEAEQISDSMTLQELMPNGILALTVDPTQGKRYQGIVALEGETLASSLSSYFASSEQLPTFFWLCANGKQAKGFLLQALPAEKQHDDEERQNTWQHLTVLANSLNADEFLAVDNITILHRLYHEEDIRLFEQLPIKFHCSCSRERSANALRSLGEQDAFALLEEQQGKITIDCQFCNKEYIFDIADVTQLFKDGSSNPPAETRH